ncbi:MAG: WGxxGxxG family protein [Sphingomicrobium sp.]
MRARIVLSLFFVTAALGPASAQNVERGGVRTETMERLSGQGDRDLIWNLVGLLGLLGLLALRQEHPDDSYHPAPLE